MRILLLVLLTLTFLSHSQESKDTTDIQSLEGTLLLPSDLPDSLEPCEEDLASIDEGMEENTGGPVFDLYNINSHVEDYLSKDSSLTLHWEWDTDKCFTGKKVNNISSLKDTIWLCLMNEDNPDFEIPFYGHVTSRYGFRRGRPHYGIDVDLVTGDSVAACWDGVVRYAKYNSGGYGNLVIVRHYNGLETYYAHLSKTLVKPNQKIKAGEMLGLGGNTGRSRGSHLHFEMRFYDFPINPEEAIDFKTGHCKSDNLFVHRGLFGYRGLLGDPAHAEYHVIRSGDTLGAIANRYHTSVRQLCAINRIRSTTVLRIGRRIRVR